MALPTKGPLSTCTVHILRMLLEDTTRWHKLTCLETSREIVVPVGDVFTDPLALSDPQTDPILPMRQTNSGYTKRPSSEGIV